jgi:hypothetical protein
VLSKQKRKRRKRKRTPGGYFPARETTLTIAEVERLFVIFKQSGAGEKSDMDAIKAITLLNRQLEELQRIRDLNYKDPTFKAWRNTTQEVLEKVLGPTSHHTTSFRDTRFYGPSYLRSDYPGVRHPTEEYEEQAQAKAFQQGCGTTEATLRAAIKHVEDFGVYVDQAIGAGSGKGRSGGMHQVFHGPVTIQNQAIATDNAVQKIGQMGDTGVSLKEIARLLQESMDLTGRQIQQGLAGVEVLASEVEKPEKDRNWNAILDSGDKLLGIAGKATDLAAKLAPYTPHILTLVEHAKHFIK